MAKQDKDIDYWFWGHKGITCGKTEKKADCSNRIDWNTMNKTVETIKKHQPTLTFIHFGKKERIDLQISIISSFLISADFLKYRRRRCGRP